MDKKSVRTGKPRLSGSRRPLARFAAAAALSIGMFSTVIHSHAIDFNEGKIVNLGGGFTVPIVDNNNQLPSSISFVAPGPTGNTVYFYDNGEIGLALRGHNGGANSFTTISHLNANDEVGFEQGTSRTSQTHYFSGSGIALPTNISNYNDVVADDLYEGVSARFEVNGRQLIGRYEVEAGSTTTAIRLNFSDISETSLNERTGDIEMTSSSGHPMQLHAARVGIEGESDLVYVPFSIDGDDVVLELADLAETDGSVIITVKITFGPYCHDYYAVNDGSNGIVAVSTGFNTMMNGADNSDADIVITRLNETGTEVVSTTILAGEQDDIGYSVAFVDAAAGPCGNRLYVAGSTTSEQFPADGERMGAADAVVIRLNEDATTVQSGMTISAAGRDVAHHIIICGCEVIVVGATDGGLADVNRAEMSFSTVFPAVAVADKVQQYYVSTLNSDLTVVENRTTVYGPALATPLRGGCSGGTVEIGVKNGTVTTDVCSASSANDVSQMQPWFSQPCPSTTTYAKEPNWGWHALCWKSKTSQTHTFQPSGCTSTAIVPRGWVLAGDAGVLNMLQAADACFAPCAGCNFNPFGVWEKNFYDQYNAGNASARAAELLLGAAFYHKKFSSPVYANWKSSGGIPDAMLISKVRMKVTDMNSSPSTLQNVCSFQFQGATKGDLFDVACLTGLTGHIIFCSAEVVPWRSFAGSGSTYPVENWSGDDLANRLASPYVYIGDPPADEPHVASCIQEVASQLSRSVTVAADVETTVYADGEAQESTTELRQIRMVDMYIPDQPVAMPTAVEEQKDDLSVSAAFGTLSSRPNPASGEITVTYQVHDAATVRLEIYDAMGQKVGVIDAGYRQPRQYSVGYHTGSLATGTYYLRLSSESGVLTMPLLIVR